MATRDATGPTCDRCSTGAPESGPLTVRGQLRLCGPCELAHWLRHGDGRFTRAALAADHTIGD